MANPWPLVFGLFFVGIGNAAIFYKYPPQEPSKLQEDQQPFGETAYADEIPQEWDQSFMPLVDVDENQQSDEPIESTDEQVKQGPAEDFYVPTRIGAASGVAVNNENKLVIFHRAGRTWDESSFNPNTNVFNTSLDVIENATLTIIDPNSGKVIGERGHGMFYMPHGLSVDPEGNYWVTDVARHQVIKLNRDFKPILELGEKMVPGSDEKHFCKPTDVAVSKQGDIFVADGYCNSRIVKFDRNGKYLGSFGAANSDPTDPKIGEFSTPHSLALIDDLNLLCVADRDNQRIQCFTAGLVPKGAHRRAMIPTGTFVTQAKSIGKLMAIREKHHYLVGLSDPNNENDFSVFIMDINSGKANTFARGITDAHSLALSDDGDIYVGQLSSNQVLKFSIPKPPEDVNPNEQPQQFDDQGLPLPPQQTQM
ncbi:Peptidylamidoglycolate lyase [Aphelenchoides besseyi]|nr:Peptidylamidoglycolate lyase [Aphelenchoides besseyi]KAI6207511.1 Peptidylamidoglycolate lyase [Aphelenchoides besseyi]